MRYALIIVIAAACNFPQPDRAPADSGGSDTNTNDAPPVEGIELSGGITVVGGEQSAGTLSVTDDGLEQAEWCPDPLLICVTGGIAP